MGDIKAPKIEGDVDVKTPKVDGDIKVDAPSVDVDVKTPKADIDVDVDGKAKGGFDINMPDISMPKFGFGGKGKKPDGSVDADVKVKTPEADVNVDLPSTDANVDVKRGGS